MTDDRTIRDRLSDTNNPASSSRRERSPCQDCEVHEEFARWRQRVDEQLCEVDGEMNALASGIAELNTEVRHSRHSSSDTSLEVFKQLGAISTQLGNLNQRLGSMLEVAAFDRSKRDAITKTPTGKLPGIAVGNFRANAPPWLFGALATLALILIAGVACVAVVVYWGAPARQQTHGGK